ncbi:hypothetical protein HPB48_017529 [Haemaphysalis longicornis]|uniref:Uncharacterized protein n=1 Tax=Haemaphysalis longicornis TaxID=44386 RepID=A0A9J6FNU8_HAELO|nr:hypothetical protein HPB48_017529 [Haemaphysalis longicornis]
MNAADEKHFFKPPNDTSRLHEWQHVTPRGDRELPSSCVVSECHFQEPAIAENVVHNICGGAVVLPRDKWSFKDDAMPRIFPNRLKYLAKPFRKRKAPAVRSRLQPKNRYLRDEAEQENAAPSLLEYGERGGSVAGSVALNSTQSLFEELSTMA